MMDAIVRELLERLTEDYLGLTRMLSEGWGQEDIERWCWPPHRGTPLCSLDQWMQLLIRMTYWFKRLVGLISQYGFGPKWEEALRKRIEELCSRVADAFARYEDTCFEAAKFITQSNLEDKKDKAWFCRCLEEGVQPLYGVIDAYMQEIQRRIEQRGQARARSRSQAQAQGVPQPYLAAVVAALVVLVGATLATLATEGGAAPAALSVIPMIVARFRREEHPDLEDMAAKWANDYILENGLLDLPTIGELASGEGWPADPTDIAQALYDLHISKLAAWAAEYVTEKAAEMGTGAGSAEPGAESGPEKLTP